MAISSLISAKYFGSWISIMCGVIAVRNKLFALLFVYIILISKNDNFLSSFREKKKWKGETEKEWIVIDDVSPYGLLSILKRWKNVRVNQNLTYSFAPIEFASIFADPISYSKFVNRESIKVLAFLKRRMEHQFCTRHEAYTSRIKDKGCKYDYIMMLFTLCLKIIKVE